jgi:hypothetical protein
MHRCFESKNPFFRRKIETSNTAPFQPLVTHTDTAVSERNIYISSGPSRLFDCSIGGMVMVKYGTRIVRLTNHYRIRRAVFGVGRRRITPERPYRITQIVRIRWTVSRFPASRVHAQATIPGASLPLSRKKRSCPVGSRSEHSSSDTSLYARVAVDHYFECIPNIVIMLNRRRTIYACIVVTH